MLKSSFKVLAAVAFMSVLKMVGGPTRVAAADCADPTFCGGEMFECENFCVDHHGVASYDCYNTAPRLCEATCWCNS